MKNHILLLFIFLSTILPAQTLKGQEQIKKIAILETVDREDAVSYGIKLMIRSSLSYAITNTPGYEGYDRVDIASIVGEHNFQRTGMVSDSQIKQLGEMTGASYILVAEAALIDASNIFITAKILNVETAKLERMASTQSGMRTNDIAEKCTELAASLFGSEANAQNIGTNGKLNKKSAQSAEERAEILRQKEERQKELKLQREIEKLEKEKNTKMRKEQERLTKEERQKELELQREKEKLENEKLQKERKAERFRKMMSRKIRYEGEVSFILSYAQQSTSTGGSTSHVGIGGFMSHGIRIVKPRLTFGISSGYQRFLCGSELNSIFIGAFPKWYFANGNKIDAYLACHIGYAFYLPANHRDYLEYYGFHSIMETGIGFKGAGKTALNLSIKGHIYRINSTTCFYPNLCLGVRF